MAAFYVTKYALTGGIRKIEGEADKSRYDDRLIVRDGYNWLVLGRDVFADESDANADAEKRRIAKIASLRKQIAKLEKLTFTTPDTGRK